MYCLQMKQMWSDGGQKKSVRKKKPGSFIFPVHKEIESAL